MTRQRSLALPLVEADKAQENRSWKPFEIEKLPVVQHTSDQSQSPLITKLPKEIRLQIFEEVLGGHWLHVVRASNRLLAIKCAEEPVSSSPTCHHCCWGLNRTITLPPTPDFYGGPSPDSDAALANLLPLLLTCRVV